MQGCFQKNLFIQQEVQTMKCDDKIKNRVKRTRGQIDGILKMMEDERECEEVLNQLSAVRSSLDKVMALIASENLRLAIDQGTDETKAFELLVRTR